MDIRRALSTRQLQNKTEVAGHREPLILPDEQQTLSHQPQKRPARYDDRCGVTTRRDKRYQSGKQHEPNPCRDDRDSTTWTSQHMHKRAGILVVRRGPVARSICLCRWRRRALIAAVALRRTRGTPILRQACRPQAGIGRMMTIAPWHGGPGISAGSSAQPASR